MTGCSRGIGRAILDAFAREGANVFALVRREDEAFSRHCTDLEGKYGVAVTPVYADLSQEEQIQTAAKQVLAEKKPVDILVNNAGIANPLKMFTMVPMQQAREAFEVNVFAGLRLSQLLGRGMVRKRRGSIIFLSSSAAFDGGANVEYSASKAAVIGMARRLAIELGGSGIRVNVLAPGLTDTDMGNSMSKEDEAVAVSRNIFGRKAEPEEIADAALFLASDLSRFVTGQVLRVDGGLLK